METEKILGNLLHPFLIEDGKYSMNTEEKQ